MAQFGEVLKALRDSKGLTQQQLSKIIFVTPGSISNYETGHHFPDIPKLIVLADYFGVTTDFLLGRVTSNVSVKILQRPILEGKTMADVINSYSKLPPDRQKLIAITIADMENSLNKMK